MINYSSNASSVYNLFEKKLSEVNKREILFNLTRGLVYTFTFIFLTGFVFLILESILKFGSPVRKIMYWSFLSVSVTTVVYFLINYFLKLTGIIRPPDIISYSCKIGNFFDDIKDKLSNALSLYKSYSGKNPDTVFSPELISAGLIEIGNKAGGLNFNSVISFSKLKKPLYILLAAILINLISFVAFPYEMKTAFKRLVNYNYNFVDNVLGISFQISPGNIDAAAGSSAEVRIIVNSTDKNFTPESILFHTREISGNNSSPENEIEIKPESDGSFKTTLENLSYSLVYFAKYKNINSEEYTINVSDYPVIKAFIVTLIPPGFTGLPSKILEENEGNIFCQEGSTIKFELTSDKALSYAGIMLNDKPVDFRVNGDKASGEFIAKESGEYKFVIRDEKGIQNPGRNTYTIKVLADRPPEITVIEPEQSSYTLNGEKDLLVRARISDDFGFSKLVLAFRKVKELTGNVPAPVFTYENIELKNPDATMLEVPYVWNISKLNLRSGESAEYFMEVTDNSGKSARSEIRTIHFKSLADLLKKNEQMTKELKTDLQSVYQEAEELQKQLQDLKKQAQRNEELGLNEEKKKQLEKKIENFQNSLNSTQSKIEQGLNELQEKNMLSEKTLEQYMELQKMFSKINTPELQKMLEKMREALKANNPDELKEAMKNFKFDEEEFKKYMEKAMELLKKIENMQKFGELTQKLDDITKKQEDLKQQTNQSDKNDKGKMKDLSEKQKDIRNQTKEFEDELKKLIDEINKMKEQMSAEDLEKLKKEMEKRSTENKMQKSSDELQQSQKNKSEETQEDIMEDLNEMNSQMQEALSKMMDSQDMQNKLMDKLKQIKKQLEELSKRQQELRDKTDELNREEKEEFEKNRTEQALLQNDLAQTIDDLMNASKMGMMMSPDLGKELGNAFNKMDKAGKDLGDQKKDNASSNQGKAKQSLDNAAKMLGDMMNKMSQDGKNGKGKGGQQPGQGNMGQLMQRLGNIIAQQMGLNGKMGKTGQNGKEGNDGKGNSPDNLSRDQKIEMQKLSLEQEMIRKSLEQLNEELKKEQEKSGEKVLGDLNEVQKEMQEIVKDLEENRVDDKLIEKQNRILSRLLDAQLSQREKDFEPKRESKPGENITRTSPPEIVLQGPNSFNALKEDFLKLQKEGYTDDYEALIQKYFMELKKSGLKTN